MMYGLHGSFTSDDRKTFELCIDESVLLMTDELETIAHLTEPHLCFCCLVLGSRSDIVNTKHPVLPEQIVDSWTEILVR
jgi:hypothetical protein